MDLTKPNTTTSGEYAGPARDEAKALSAQNCGTARGDPASGREVGAGTGVMRQPLRADYTSRPYPEFRSSREHVNHPTMTPITTVGDANEDNRVETINLSAMAPITTVGAPEDDHCVATSREALFGCSMDLNKANTTTSGEYAGPARDEAKVLSAQDCGTAKGDSASGREVGAGPGVMRQPLRADQTSRPYPKFRSSKVHVNRPTMAPITTVGAAEEDNSVRTSLEESGVDAPFPNPVTPPIVDKTMRSPEREESQTIDNWNGLTRRQKRRENARKRALQQQTSGSFVDEPEAGSSNGRKRSLAMTADSSQTCTEVKRAKVDSQVEISSEKVAIIPVNFPAEQILQSHIAGIQETIITRLVDAADPLPHVSFSHLVGGAMFFNCLGRDSVTWLSATISDRRIGELSLKVVDAKDLPKPVKMAWKTRIVGVQDIKLLLRVLQRYNPSLHTDQWKVVDTSLDNTSSRRIILMDRASADVIRDAGYHLHSGIDISVFKLLEDSERGAKCADGSKDATGDPI